MSGFGIQCNQVLIKLARKCFFLIYFQSVSVIGIIGIPNWYLIIIMVNRCLCLFRLYNQNSSSAFLLSIMLTSESLLTILKNSPLSIPVKMFSLHKDKFYRIIFMTTYRNNYMYFSLISVYINNDIFYNVVIFHLSVFYLLV